LTTTFIRPFHSDRNLRAELLRNTKSVCRGASCHSIVLNALDAIVYSRHQLLDGVCSAFGCKVGAECLAYQRIVTQSSWNTRSASFTKIHRRRPDNAHGSGFQCAHGPGAERGWWSCMHAELLVSQHLGNVRLEVAKLLSSHPAPALFCCHWDTCS
jgi:hypothetical protein